MAEQRRKQLLDYRRTVKIKLKQSLVYGTPELVAQTAT